MTELALPKIDRSILNQQRDAIVKNLSKLINSRKCFKSC